MEIVTSAKVHKPHYTVAFACQLSWRSVRLQVDTRHKNRSTMWWNSKACDVIPRVLVSWWRHLVLYRYWRTGCVWGSYLHLALWRASLGTPLENWTPNLGWTCSTYRLNWARRTSWGWWDDWDDTVLQTQDSKFEPWRSEAEHATSRSLRLPTILTFIRGWGRNIFVSFKPPRPGTEPRTLAW